LDRILPNAAVSGVMKNEKVNVPALFSLGNSVKGIEVVLLLHQLVEGALL
jgi:hypothetical protein